MNFAIYKLYLNLKEKEETVCHCLANSDKPNISKLTFFLMFHL